MDCYYDDRTEEYGDCAGKTRCVDEVADGDNDWIAIYVCAEHAWAYNVFIWGADGWLGVKHKDKIEELAKRRAKIAERK